MHIMCQIGGYTGKVLDTKTIQVCYVYAIFSTLLYLRPLAPENKH